MVEKKKESRYSAVLNPLRPYAMYSMKKGFERKKETKEKEEEGRSFITSYWYFNIYFRTQ